MSSTYILKVCTKGFRDFAKHSIPLGRQILINRKNKVDRLKFKIAGMDFSKQQSRSIQEKLEKNWNGKNHTDKFNHGYAPLYASMITLFGNLEFNLIEFGIGGNGPNPVIPPGSSLRTWREVHPSIRLYGFDIDPRTIFQEDRIVTMQVDQTKISEIIKLMSLIPTIASRPELWIDDALHEPGGFLPIIRVALEANKPILTVIEDLWAPYFVFLYIFFKAFYPKSKFVFYRCVGGSDPIEVKSVRDLAKTRGWSNILAFTN